MGVAVPEPGVMTGGSEAMKRDWRSGETRRYFRMPENGRVSALERPRAKLVVMEREESERRWVTVDSATSSTCVHLSSIVTSSLVRLG